jgi:SAM-dependent methyltransferase
MQAHIDPFQKHASRYEAWFDRHRLTYEAEIGAVQTLLPGQGMGLEIGAGTGRFAAPLGVRFGIDPAGAMCQVARRRGVRIAAAVGEALPIKDRSLDYALMVTTICFLDDVATALKEARRVLKPGGSLVVGFVDRDSPLGRAYQEHKQENIFYRVAEFFSADEVVSCLQDAGFQHLASAQTIFRPLEEIREPERIEDGTGEGSFVVVRGDVPEISSTEP